MPTANSTSSKLLANFLNSSAGFTPTIFVFPSYPDPASSISLFYEGSETHLGVGLFDGATADGTSTGPRGPSTFFNDDLSNSYLVLGEAERHWAGTASWGPGRIGVGGWYHTGTFAEFSGGQSDGTGGGYLVAEQQVYRENPEVDGDEQGLNLFMTVGFADERVTEFKSHYLAGFSYVGPLDERDDDSLGILVSHVDLTDDSAAGIPHDETACECYYRVQVTPFMSVTTDLQYIVNPSGSATIPNAVVGTLRFELIF